MKAGTLSSEGTVNVPRFVSIDQGYIGYGGFVVQIYHEHPFGSIYTYIKS